MISDNKLKHILGVACQCQKIAEEYGMSEEEQNAAFVMGFLHDIGYRDVAEDKHDISSHPEYSENMISDFLKHSEECLNAIAKHGKNPDNDIWSYILNKADLMSDYQGKDISIEERVEGIKTHHGEESEHTKNAIKMAEFVKSRKKIILPKK